MKPTKITNDKPKHDSSRIGDLAEHYASPPFTVSIGSHDCSVTTHWRHPSETEFGDIDDVCYYCAKEIIKNNQ